MERNAPAPALMLGIGGLLPFVGLAAVIGFGPPESHAYGSVMLSHYGAVILSFVGALHWAYAVKRDARGGEAWIRYAFSVAPALAAWLSLQLPVAASLRLQAAGLVICMIFDWRMLRFEPQPKWFLRMRVGLTVVAATSLMLASTW